MVTLALSFLFVVCAAGLGRLAWHWIGRYGEHQQAIRTPNPVGQCALRRCTRRATEGSDYCSTQHELDDEWNAAGF